MSTTQTRKRIVPLKTYRGLSFDQLHDLPQEELITLFRARTRRRFSRKQNHQYSRLLIKCRKSKENVGPGDKLVPVRTHLRNAVILPEMVGNTIGVYNGRRFSNIEIKFDMIGRYLGELAMTKKKCQHGKIGATKGCKCPCKK